MTLSTHVLDTALGVPAAGLEIVLYRCRGDAREQIAAALTNADGRVPAPFGGELEPGEYELTFAAGEYFKNTGTQSFYDRVPVRFFVGGAAHYHVPLLLSPWGTRRTGKLMAPLDGYGAALNAAQPPKCEMSLYPRSSIKLRG